MRKSKTIYNINNSYPIEKDNNKTIQIFTLLLNAGWKIYIAILFLSQLTFLLTGCEKETNWDIKHDSLDILIVDGILTNELKPQQIKLSYSVQDLNSPARPCSNIQVEVTDSINTYIFTEDKNNPGTYLSNSFIAVAGKNYYLKIQTDTAIYQAQANATAVTPLQSLLFDVDTASSLYSYLNIEDTKPSMVEVSYNWSVDSAYCQTYGYCLAAETFYTLNNVDVNKAFGPEKQKIKFPKGTIITRKKYSLTEEHQQFLRSLLIETEWRGGLFDVQQGNVMTNMTNGAKGFFAVCMVVKDTNVVE